MSSRHSEGVSLCISSVTRYFVFGGSVRASGLFGVVSGLLSPPVSIDLALSEGFNFGLWEGRYGAAPLSGVWGRLLGCSHELFPSIWGSRKAALSPSEALPLAGRGLWGTRLGASPERFPLVCASGKPVLEECGYSGMPGGWGGGSGSRILEPLRSYFLRFGCPGSP